MKTTNTKNAALEMTAEELAHMEARYEAHLEEEAYDRRCAVQGRGPTSPDGDKPAPGPRYEVMSWDDEDLPF